MSGASVFFDDVGAGYVRRHQVGRELNTLERKVEHVRDRANQQGLGEPRRACYQRVTADEQRDERLIDDLILSNDDLADFAEDLFPRRDKLVAGCYVYFTFPKPFADAAGVSIDWSVPQAADDVLPMLEVYEPGQASNQAPADPDAPWYMLLPS